mgnify:CR=1 FL=1
MTIKKGDIKKTVVGIIEIIVGLILIVLHVTGIIKAVISFWGIYFIMLAVLLVVFIVLWRFVKGERIKKIAVLSLFSKTAVFLLIVMFIVDYFNKLPPTLEVIKIISWWSVAIIGIWGTILTREQKGEQGMRLLG